ncbi:hypothetical protein L198_08210 [Cryptococcus wingfieldii CBS 7118]|uniref:Uncharacterized protein n=1 Tax=Cryptococcus wingfieldii CBS 7118 TaxID=1295528 RepID=A0A1E3HEW7_9TREE|nr:hypothetical protein L198_08210 [Cryptococcus wingfieldii CBS 7118]ODN74903.1 hypothetical protein L198_08210 [Cryptococcus wingfieldii CBS 7118]
MLIYYHPVANSQQLSQPVTSILPASVVAGVVDSTHEANDAICDHFRSYYRITKDINIAHTEMEASLLELDAFVTKVGRLSAYAQLRARSIRLSVDFEDLLFSSATHSAQLSNFCFASASLVRWLREEEVGKLTEEQSEEEVRAAYAQLRARSIRLSVDFENLLFPSATHSAQLSNFYFASANLVVQALADRSQVANRMVVMEEGHKEVLEESRQKYEKDIGNYNRETQKLKSQIVTLEKVE